MKYKSKTLRLTQLILLFSAMAYGISSCVHLTREPAAFERPVLKPLVLVGLIPGQYLNKTKSRFYLGYVEINNRVIQKVAELKEADVSAFVEAEKVSKTVVILRASEISAVTPAPTPETAPYDAIYPGLLNLHNHTKQNVLPTWSAAKGQFQNRFEWREWINYKKSVSKNMNPWIGYGPAMNCAAFRWSHLQNMINGTTYLQGPSSCITGFGIYKVEDASAYISAKAAVQAPTDLVYPNEMVYVWSVLKADIQSGMSYEAALLKNIRHHCEGPEIDKVTVENINKAEGLKVLSSRKTLEAACTKDVANIHPKFVRYVYYVHKAIAGKIEYAKNPNRAAVIAHLAEGRRLDPYNQIEYQLIKLLGLNKPNVNFIHGVGLRGDGLRANDATDLDDDFLDMAQNGMGLIWSPYSNLLLYGETLDIEAAHRAGINLAIGSDWVPTGTKSVLEEIKLAAQYVDRTKTQDGRRRLSQIFNDEYLYKMMTENSAKIINHWEIKDGEAGVGQLAVGAMGSVIAVSVQDQNPFTNLVRKATEKEINLVVVDGALTYGNVNYLEQGGITQYEVFSNEVAEGERLAMTESIPRPNLENLRPIGESEESDTEMAEPVAAANSAPSFLTQLAQAARQTQLNRAENCRFPVRKAFVTPNTKAHERHVDQFFRDTQIDLDKVADLQLLLAVASMTQSLNRISPDGDVSFAMQYFPSLYTCNETAEKNSHRYKSYINASGNDELKINLTQRGSLRQGVPKKAEALAELYGLAFEVR